FLLETGGVGQVARPLECEGLEAADPAHPVHQSAGQRLADGGNLGVRGVDKSPPRNPDPRHQGVSPDRYDVAAEARVELKHLPLAFVAEPDGPARAARQELEPAALAEVSAFV